MIWENISIWFCPDSLVLALAFSSSPCILFQRIFELPAKEYIWRNSCSSAFEAFGFKLRALFCLVI